MLAGVPVESTISRITGWQTAMIYRTRLQQESLDEICP